MLYAIMARDVPDSLPLRKITRPRHLEYLQPLIDAGRLRFAGAHPAIDAPVPGPAGFTGGLVVAGFYSQGDCEAWAAKDPYVLEGVFAEVTSKPVLQV